MIRKALLAGATLAVLLAGEAGAFELRNAPGPVPVAMPGQSAQQVIQVCIETAARVHRLPAQILVVILRVENGRLGRISPNASGAPPDVGPMQVNAMWLTRLAARWGVSREEAFLALRDDFCTNVEAGAWLLREAMNDAKGDFWEGVAFYHSRTPEFKRRYKRLALEQALAVARLAPSLDALTTTTAAAAQ
ncbi:lytic transglycosylase domain-containing protein [Paeniroseomonas aquatica]|uniref:Lytic transglycosylase domain-containing protein n=1 Tax=Paeniroseomonas aquatica TaxID=373043 RepID=A0ABT8A056_9PROT|nr:lytic transglycosylase domain-containing protein [Paeniroseomonas aquatica]MDN3563107.1 lytic transglycosylase domain-containing protein [Paeniroseomonas aquatica]